MCTNKYENTFCHHMMCFTRHPISKNSFASPRVGVATKGRIRIPDLFRAATVVMYVSSLRGAFAGLGLTFVVTAAQDVPGEQPLGRLHISVSDETCWWETPVLCPVVSALCPLLLFFARSAASTCLYSDENLPACSDCLALNCPSSLMALVADASQQFDSFTFS